MHLKRLLLRAKNNQLVGIFSSNNIQEEEFISKNLFGEQLSLFNAEPYSTRPEYSATYDMLIATFTKPQFLESRNNASLYVCNIIFAKTKQGQAIIDVNTWEEIEQLDLFKGPANRLKIFFVVYNNMIKFAIEDVYQSVPNSSLCEILKTIIEKTFLNEILAEDGNRNISIFNKDDFELVIDYTEEDFESTFNASRRNKKIVFYIDTIDEADEVINSAQLIYSVKSDSILQETLERARARYGYDGIARFTIKCEDSNGKIASIMSENGDLQTEEWQAIPTISIGEYNTQESINRLFEFLRN